MGLCYRMLLIGWLLAGISCQNNQRSESELPQMELVLVDSLTTDILKPLNMIDFHKEKIHCFNKKVLYSHS